MALDVLIIIQIVVSEQLADSEANLGLRPVRQVILLDLLELGPNYISCAFDESLNTCFRNEIYPDYKANREMPDANLEFQLAACQEITALLGVQGNFCHIAAIWQHSV